MNKFSKEFNSFFSLQGTPECYDLCYTCHMGCILENYQGEKLLKQQISFQANVRIFKANKWTWTQKKSILSRSWFWIAQLSLITKSICLLIQQMSICAAANVVRMLSGCYLFFTSVFCSDVFNVSDRINDVISLDTQISSKAQIFLFKLHATLLSATIESHEGMHFNSASCMSGLYSANAFLYLTCIIQSETEVNTTVLRYQVSPELVRGFFPQVFSHCPAPEMCFYLSPPSRPSA